jgi:hypothetical protein
MVQVSSFLLSANAPGRYVLSPTQILCQLPKTARQSVYYKVLQALEGDKRGEIKRNKRFLAYN